MTTFKEFNLNQELMKSLDDLGFINPSPIQEKAIPFILESKKDLIALAQTGTGKTAAFGLPILNQMETKKRNVQTIILCPTRELCIQISQDMKQLAKYSKGVNITPVYGGERIDIQIRSLKKGANIVIGTPGRVCDLIKRKSLKLQTIKWLVLDEADEMLDMGFKEDLDTILAETPGTKQTLFFSATISKKVRFITKQYMQEPEEISVGEKNIGADNVSHEYYTVQVRDRFESLKRILDNIPGVYGILFCRTRNQTQEIADKLKQSGYNAEPLHGEISQTMRTKIMDRFKRKQIQLLVATDVAARGIDVNDLTHVINYNLPDQNESYTHRSGRTGRAQKSGVSISILTLREVRRIKELERIIGKKFEHKKIPNGEEVCHKQIDNFIKEIEKIDITKISNDKYFSKTVDKLKKLKKEELIKRFITYKFNHLMNTYKNARDLNTVKNTSEFKKKNINGVDLKINFGKKQGLEIKGLFGLLNSNKKLKGVDVGRINIMSEYLIFSVDKKNADRVINNLQGANFKGGSINIVKSDKSFSYSSSNGRRSGSSRSGFRSRKKRFRGR